MKHNLTVPSPGESITGGILAKWLKADGAAVNDGDEIFELETDKATMAVPTTVSGVLKHMAAEGDEVEVGQVVASIAAAEAEPRSAPATALSPAVRALVRQSEIDVSTLKGTGKQGRILKKDVEAAIRQRDEAAAQEPPRAPEPPPPAEAKRPETKATPPSSPPAPRPPVPSGRQTREKMSSLRKRIAENLVLSRREGAHLTTFNEIDMQRIMNIRKQYGEAFEKRHQVRLGFMSVFVKACSRGLLEFPGVNAMIDGEEIVYNHFCNIGVAVSTERGLIVPVLKEAEGMSFAAIETAIRDLAQRARDKQLTVNDLTGGTFTITNGGIFGSLLSTPIPTPPQTAILGMHTIQKRPVAIDDQVVIRPMMYVALTYDHRVIDGKEAVGFLARVKQVVEDPDSLLFDL